MIMNSVEVITDCKYNTGKHQSDGNAIKSVSIETDLPGKVM